MTNEILGLMPIGFWITLAGIFGLLIGSFFNVVIYRMPRGESVVWPPSRCTRCDKRIAPFDNIPILSYVLLRGKCRGCGATIGIFYPLVEAATCAMAIILALFLLSNSGSFHPAFAWGFAYFCLVAIPITLIDLRHYLIPDVLSLPGILLGLALSFWPGGLTPWESAVGALGAGGLLYMVGFIATKVMKKDAMGFGDVKLLGMAGALFGLKSALLGLLFASFLGTLAGIPVLLWRKGNGHHRIPFGPFLCLGCALSALYGEAFLTWYTGWLGLR